MSTDGESTLPAWMPSPETPQPARDEAWFPHVISQKPDGYGNVLVTFAMPELTTAIVRVPQSAWLEGEHLRIPPALVPIMFPLPSGSGDPPGTQADDAGDDG